jgi:NitT/TauT family transport system permease protein
MPTTADDRARPAGAALPDGGRTIGEARLRMAAEAELSGLDALDRAGAAGAGPAQSGRRAAWSALWPKLAACGLGLGGWQAVVAAGWKPRYVLPGPVAVGQELVSMTADGTLPRAVANTLMRAGLGFALALVLGVAAGSVMARHRLLRSAFGSLLTGIQTMPSIAWFPLAILLFQLSEKAILFVLVLGAAPAVANGLIAGADQIPPILLRAGRVLGARGFAAWRHVVLPASLPSFVGGLKQGWAFAWRSLMAGELLVIIAEKPSIGSVLQVRRNLADAKGLIATMIVILVIGIVVDTAVFGRLERAVLRRWGLAAERR